MKNARFRLAKMIVIEMKIKSLIIIKFKFKFLSFNLAKIFYFDLTSFKAPSLAVLLRQCYLPLSN
jgi:hypothetical protein